MRYKNFESFKEVVKGFYAIKMIERPSPIVIIAPHAGTIEPHTGNIAREIARNVYSLYRFIGHHRPKGMHKGWLHLSSEKFDEPGAVRLVESHKLALAVHGLKDPGPGQRPELNIYVGGRNKAALAKVVEKLQNKGFKADDCTGFGGFQHKGTAPKNIVNQSKGGGVQLEITRRERRKLVRDGERMNRFCNAIRDALDSLVR